MRGINGARLQISARALGLARFLLDRSIEYAQQRTAFGKPIGANQFVQGMIVELHAELEQACLLVYQQAAEIDDGADGRRQAPPAKMVAAEMVGRVADRAIQVNGGNGFMTELGLEGWYRDVRAMRLYEGTGEILRANVAKTLGLPSHPDRREAAATPPRPRDARGAHGHPLSGAGPWPAPLVS